MIDVPVATAGSPAETATSEILLSFPSLVFPMGHKTKPHFGYCNECEALLNEEEYHLGLGRCKSCARKCDDDRFGTQYGNATDEASQGARTTMENVKR